MSKQISTKIQEQEKCKERGYHQAEKKFLPKYKDVAYCVDCHTFKSDLNDQVKWKYPTD